MAKAYSIDLRERVVRKFKEKVPVENICRVFCVSAKSVYRWVKLDKEQGNVESKKQVFRGGYKPKLEENQYQVFDKFLMDNMGLNGIQLAEKWGCGMTPKTMRMWIKRRRFTLKKNNLRT